MFRKSSQRSTNNINLWKKYDQSDTPIQDAIQDNLNIDMFKQIVKRYLQNIDSSNGIKGITPLIMASIKKLPFEYIQLLLIHHADGFKKEEINGMNAFHYMMVYWIELYQSNKNSNLFKDHTKSILLLYRTHPKLINQPDDHGITAAHMMMTIAPELIDYLGSHGSIVMTRR